MNPRRLYRSRSHRMFAGVCGGVAEYLNVDPTIVRLLTVIFTFLGGAGLWAYLIAMFIVPDEPTS